MMKATDVVKQSNAASKQTSSIGEQEVGGRNQVDGISMSDTLKS
jgi:hypothetical protein